MVHIYQDSKTFCSKRKTKSVPFIILNSMKILVHDRSVCLECAGCVGVCPKMALDMYGLDLQIDLEKCIRCGLCTRACPAGALTLEEVGNAQ